MSTETMTPRERWLAVLHRQKPDRTPTDYWGTPETGQKLKLHFRVTSLHKALDRMHVDYLVTAAPRYVGPRLAPHRDVFGIQYRDIDYGSGVYPEAFTHPLARFDTVEQIESGYRWPDPDWWDYSGIAERLRGHEDRAVRGGGSEPFLTYKYLRGDEQAMVDLLENPEIVEYCLGKLFDLAYQNTLRIYEAVPGRVDLSYVAEDMGGQNDLMIAPRQIRRFLLPGMKRMIDLAHGAGVVVFHHNDGNITRILPELVELGIDVLNPIQWRAGVVTNDPTPNPSPERGGEEKNSGNFAPMGAKFPDPPGLIPHPERHSQAVRKIEGMDRQMLKRRYGERLIFHGAVDNQYTLPFGTVEEVRQEVRDNLAMLGAGGGYILAPCHNIQPVTPVENIIAMYETAYREG